MESDETHLIDEEYIVLSKKNTSKIFENPKKRLTRAQRKLAALQEAPAETSRISENLLENIDLEYYGLKSDDSEIPPSQPNVVTSKRNTRRHLSKEKNANINPLLLSDVSTHISDEGIVNSHLNSKNVKTPAATVSCEHFTDNSYLKKSSRNSTTPRDKSNKDRYIPDVPYPYEDQKSLKSHRNTLSQQLQKPQPNKIQDFNSVQEIKKSRYKNSSQSQQLYSNSQQYSLLKQEPAFDSYDEIECSQKSEIKRQKFYSLQSRTKAKRTQTHPSDHIFYQKVEEDTHVPCHSSAINQNYDLDFRKPRQFMPIYDVDPYFANYDYFMKDL